jgi:hypothetical protein
MLARRVRNDCLFLKSVNIRLEIRQLKLSRIWKEELKIQRFCLLMTDLEMKSICFKNFETFFVSINFL